MHNLFFFKQVFKNFFKGRISSALDIKYYRQWAYYLTSGRSAIKDRLPWINFPAIEYLKNKIKPEHVVFEFGGGGSTLFFLDRVKLVVTVEHDKEWFKIIESKILDKQKWKGNLILPEEGNFNPSLNISNPDHYFSDDAAFNSQTFYKYASYIDQFPDEYFDIILIDGRSRPSCIKHAVNKIKAGGILILDNAERSYYLKNNYLKDFKLLIGRLAPLPYLASFTQTNIYIK